MQTFCTIITADHFPLTKTLLSSLQKQDPASLLHVLVLDNNAIPSEPDLHILNIEEARKSEWFRQLEKKYAHTEPDKFRWALKPFVINWLLQKGFDKVIYIDPDIYFTGAFNFLWKELDEYDVLLTPHWGDQEMTSKDGLYNAGFIGVSRGGKQAIDWWGEACLSKMERGNGYYDDQKYLDILPEQFKRVKVLEHQGCNLASWNIQRCKRQLVNGRLLINGKYEPVFIHFTQGTVRHILNRNDILLKPFLDEYAHILLKNGFDLYKELETNAQNFDSIFYKAKHRLRFRTRLKNFFHRLAGK